MVTGKLFEQWRLASLALIPDPVFAIRCSIRSQSNTSNNLRYIHLDRLVLVKRNTDDASKGNHSCNMTFEQGHVIHIQFSNASKLIAWTDALSRVAIYHFNEARMADIREALMLLRAYRPWRLVLLVASIVLATAHALASVRPNNKSANRIGITVFSDNEPFASDQIQF
eukprot:jgi/Hompol1/3381/HPOL_006498-RA